MEFSGSYPNGQLVAGTTEFMVTTFSPVLQLFRRDNSFRLPKLLISVVLFWQFHKVKNPTHVFKLSTKQIIVANACISFRASVYIEKHVAITWCWRFNASFYKLSMKIGNAVAAGAGKSALGYTRLSEIDYSVSRYWAPATNQRNKPREAYSIWVHYIPQNVILWSLW